MWRVALALFTLFALTLFAPTGGAQPKYKSKPKDDKGKMTDPFEGPVSLLRSKNVQKELKLTAKQVQQVGNLDKVVAAVMKDDKEKYLARVPNPKAAFRVVTNEEVYIERRRVELLQVQTVLMPAQLKRLTEIRLQLHGPAVVGAVAGFVGGPTDFDPTVTTVLVLTPKQQEDAVALRRANFPAKEPAWKDVREKFEALLTDEQKPKWKALLGEPFAP
ncbi:MAG: hypothetical protein FJ304_02535 [Planctomycetes bacterium]|nr:hypothetical protein [Planctomycetota bacterium]